MLFGSLSENNGGLSLDKLTVPSSEITDLMFPLRRNYFFPYGESNNPITIVLYVSFVKNRKYCSTQCTTSE